MPLVHACISVRNSRSVLCIDEVEAGRLVWEVIRGIHSLDTVEQILLMVRFYDTTLDALLVIRFDQVVNKYL